MTLGRRQTPWYHPNCRNAAALKTFLTEGNRRNFFRKLRGGPQKPFANLSFSGQKALCLARFLIIPIKAEIIILNYNRIIITAEKVFVKQNNCVPVTK